MATMATKRCWYCLHYYPAELPYCSHCWEQSHRRRSKLAAYIEGDAPPPEPRREMVRVNRKVIEALYARLCRELEGYPPGDGPRVRQDKFIAAELGRALEDSHG